jgi:RNA polymerase sigma-70 factor (ECF subfamily)
MPPHPLWLAGREQMRRWWLDHRDACAGGRLVPVAVSGSPAVAQFQPGPGGEVPFALQVLDVAGGRIRGITSFVDARLVGLLSPEDLALQPA